MRGLTSPEVKEELRKANKGRYDFSDLKFTGYSRYLSFTCPEHGIVIVTPVTLRKVPACPGCMYLELKAQGRELEMHKPRCLGPTDEQVRLTSGLASKTGRLTEHCPSTNRPMLKQLTWKTGVKK